MVLNSTRGILLQILSIQMKDVITCVTTKRIFRTVTFSLFHNNKSDYSSRELEIHYFFVIFPSSNFFINYQIIIINVFSYFPDLLCSRLFKKDDAIA